MANSTAEDWPSNTKEKGAFSGSPCRDFRNPFFAFNVCFYVKAVQVMGVFANSSMEKGYEGQIVVKSSNLLIPKSLKKKKKEIFNIVIEVAIHRGSNTQV